MNAVIFVRANRPSDLEKQLVSCSDYARKLNLEILEVVYCNSKNTDSPYVYENYAELLGAYTRHANNMDVVLVSNIDRITRSKRLYKILSTMLKELGVTIQTTEVKSVGTS